MQKSLSLSFSNLQFFPFHPPLPATPSAAVKVRFLTSLQKKQSAPKSLHFYSYKYRFRAPRSPPDTKPEWPFDWQLSPFHPNTNEIHKHTSNWLESPAQHQRQISGGMAVDLQNEHSGGWFDYSPADLYNNYPASPKAEHTVELIWHGIVELWQK